VLTPLILPDNHPLRGLQGISVDVGIKAGSLQLVRSLLFTHKGVSGPAGLVASCFWRSGQSLTVDFLPQAESKASDNASDPLFEGENERRTASGVLRRFFPQRLADALLVIAQRQAKEPLKLERPLAEWGKTARSTLSSAVHRCDITPIRTEGLRTAEAAAGGVLTKDLNPRTMESRLVPNLYIIGELVDITGLLGGFNLHWAFASGKAAGEALFNHAKQNKPSPSDIR